ncbi:DUF4148 domain-containing protein [Paraburkholderia phenoliruptrix]|uniref:DUF4148 domain-containing protein n=1 Tax=Paraburkholderia phenoliruptrix TaxID=252970 RepID=A0ABV3WIE0_9BURK|nr:DUF4148 domain-containing protein [Paraburkholderia phenoliruptrix]MDR6391209.1 enolase [Paraburkholderia phenoliruptrix]
MKSSHANRAASRALFSLISTVAFMIASPWARAQASPETGHPLTRAEVMHELEELEAAGYNPSLGDDGQYPADIQEAERKVAAMHAAQKSALMDQDPAMQSMPMPVQK